MTQWLPTDQLWHGALAIVPVAAAAAALARLAPCRPSTRHAMWLAVLALLVAVPWAPPLRLPAHLEPQPLRGERAPARDARAGAPAPPAAAAPTPTPAPASAAPIFRPPGAPTPAVAPKRIHARSSPSGADAPAPAAGPPRPHSSVAPSGRPESAPGADTGATGAAPAGGLLDAAGPVRSYLGQWRTQLAAVRDAVIALPPLPPSIWGGGILLLAGIAAARFHRARLLLAEARPAGAGLQRQVARSAAALGLRRPPVALVTDRAISPMLWCGRRVRLVLPAALWAQLDETGRDAVLCHELAHLKRRDHWVCRAELLVGWIYWWHPVVWWIRRRLHEDADLCCDAWVTALLPSGRRAYAQALLDSRRMSNSLAAGPSVGLGASSLRARRFARRLTMIMTAQHRPRLSLRGAALVGALGLIGYLVSPLWACPPEKSKSSGGTEKPSYVLVPSAPRAPRAPTAPTPRAAPAPAPAPEPGLTTFEQHMRGRGAGDDVERSLERRIEELERQLEQLHRELERLGRLGFPGGVSVTPAPPAPPMVAMAMGGTAPGVAAGEAVAAGAGLSAGCLSAAALSTGPVVVRTYQVPEGKLESLGELMARSDVPIRIRVVEGAIEVHASEGQQCVFESFLGLINGQERSVPYALPEGRLQALSELMVRSDVPILVSPGDDALTVHGNDVEQAVFRAFVLLISPSSQEAAGVASPAAGTISRVRQYEAQAAAVVAQLRELRAAQHSQERQMEAVERQAERMQEKAEQLREKADEAAAKAQEYEDQAAELAASDRSADRARAEDLLAKAEGARAKAESAIQAADELEAQAEQLREQLAVLEEQVEQMQEQIQELEELESQEDSDDDDEQ